MNLNFTRFVWHWIRHPLREYRQKKLYGSIGKIGQNVTIEKPDILTYPEQIEIGDNSVILEHARLQLYPYLTGTKAKICIGKNCYLCGNLSILAGADVIIHDGCLFASNILVTSQEHGINPEDKIYYMDQKLRCAPVEIGEGSWIGEKAVILSGVNIGKKCVIGASAVVTHDVPDYCIAVGSPAKVVKKYDFNLHEWVRV